MSNKDKVKKYALEDLEMKLAEIEYFLSDLMDPKFGLENGAVRLLNKTVMPYGYKLDRVTGKKPLNR